MSILRKVGVSAERMVQSLLKKTRPVSAYAVCKYGVFEPDYLDSSGPEVPLYDTLNIQVKSFDFAVLEQYSKYVHNTIVKIGISVSQVWPAPCQVLNIKNLKPNTHFIQSEYVMNLYERNIQITDLEATKLPVLIEILQTTLPSGVEFKIHECLPEHEEYRYVPDRTLNELKAQLEAMGGPTRSRRRKH